LAAAERHRRCHLLQVIRLTALWQRHVWGAEIAGVDNAGVDSNGWNYTGGHCRSEQWRSIRQWTSAVTTLIIMQKNYANHVAEGNIQIKHA